MAIQHPPIEKISVHVGPLGKERRFRGFHDSPEAEETLGEGKLTV